ncbi:arylsulfatase [Flammeovirga pacifica]|uniref:Arylsulfatase n=1 Tax=Flammeovirga pacifica TaxID=915059 RepID=A0A1S1Z1B8_FLAPC|nr:arylsulfatase [Flammeovirga pacifica]OHX67060.1 arylsulfatase [Flammeovirga pacifica]
MKSYLITFLSFFIFLSSCSTQKKKGNISEDLDRTVLPIQPPKHKAVSELDARNVTAPPKFEINAPEGAPNIVVILIDDIGFSASEPFGGAIETPTFGKLADNGLKFNKFHSTALCSPTRASLLSGRNHHNANVGSVMEVATANPGNNGFRPDDAKYVAETLRQNGYSTAAFGKWHETAPWETSVSGPFFRWPTNSGFDKFYGFIGGETNMWNPTIYDGSVRVEVETDGEEEYHFTQDMTNEAINWVKFQKAMTPDKPFMVYYAPGAVHAPHHAPKEWIEKYSGKFDEGYDELREKTFQRQKALGIIPQNTKLAPRPDGIKDWDSLSDSEKKLFAVQMETYAGFMEHTDHEIGRMIDAIDEVGELENTLIVYIMGDNGSSAEGGLIGTFNEMVSLNANRTAETVDSMLEYADEWGGPNSFPHFTAAWAVATDVPFSWTKQVAGDFGGTRNGMVMHWPNGFDAKGEIRSQFTHVNDVAPTILEAAGLPEAKMINGVEQKPMDGQSLLYAARDEAAVERHDTQYFEMFGNRAIYHKGWLARVVHSVPWEVKPVATLQEDKWELFNIEEDFSLANDLSAKYPSKLEELKLLFEKEAMENNVYPLDDRKYERFNAAIAGRPDLMGDRTNITLADGMTGITENTFLNVKNTSKTITATLDLKGNDRGVIICQGGQFGGWSLYMNDGKPTYTYNWLGLNSTTITSSKAIPAGESDVKLVFDYDGGGNGKGGLATLYINNEKVGSGRIEQTTPLLFSLDETVDVGRDDATQVAYEEFKNTKDSDFTGYVKSVTVTIPEKK